MDDLRWILLMVGAVVVAAIYFSGRFESEDWTRERKQFAKQFAKDRASRAEKKAQRKKVAAKPSPAVAREIVKKEPRMGVIEPIENGTVVKEPTVSDRAADVSMKKTARPEVAKVDPIPADHSSTIEEATPSVEIKDAEPVEASIAEQSAEEPPVEEPPMEEPPTEELPTEELPTEELPTEELPTEELIAADIEDEITDVEIPVDLAVAEAEIHIADIPEDKAPARAEMPLDIEPLVLSVIVHAEEGEFFQGAEIREALEAEGLVHGAMSIFHFHDPDKEDVSENDDAVFSVANVLEPGFFELDKLDEMQSPGLMLFCQLPGPLPGEAALDLMLDKARGLAVRLGGQMCDDKRTPFTTQAKNYYRDRISTFTRELELAKKKASGTS